MLFPHIRHSPVQFDGSTLNGKKPSGLAVSHGCCFCFGGGGKSETSEKSQIRVKTNPDEFFSEYSQSDMRAAPLGYLLC